MDLIRFEAGRGHRYEWVEATEFGAQDAFVWLVRDEGGPDGEIYSPLEDEPALFRAFADTPMTREGIAAFARRYGLLGLPSPPLQGTSGGAWIRGERLDRWEVENRRLRFAVDVWDAVTDEPRKLNEWIQLEPGGDHLVTRALFERDGNCCTIAAKHDDDTYTKPDLWALLQDLPRLDALSRAAQFYVQLQINKNLEGQASARFLYNPDAGGIELRVMPRNLLAAIWVQFARAVAGNVRQQRCAVCGEWFQGKRSHAIYCSDRCRVQRSREKRAEATKRADAGEPLKAIAKDLDTDVSTIRGWLQAAARR